jgi:hypothetical protein
MIDTKWSDEQKKEVSKKFLLDSIIVENAIKGLSEFIIDSIVWKTENPTSRYVLLYKNLSGGTGTPVEKNDLVYESKPLNSFQTENMKYQKYGINNFTHQHAFQSKDDSAQFFLKGFKDAGKIYVSGTFNGWSTLKNPMQKCDSGWYIRMALHPGKYLYKYIIDGRWTIDPQNKEKEANEHGTFNSIVYVYNHIFELQGYTNAKKVYLSGIFNNWNPKSLSMIKTVEGWKLPIFLCDGTYSYKYIVDRNWITDPDNPLIRKDGNGNLNSYIEVGNRVIIGVKGYRDVQKMIVSGSFNNWNDIELPMQKNDSGWQLSYVLGAGTYEYKFIADGIWMIDSLNPYTIYTGGFQNSVLSVQTNHIFELMGYQNAKTVIVTGTFNSWNTSGYTMKKENNHWIMPLYLNKGKHLYKFIVDDTWIIDPQNPLHEKNEKGTENSILWID